MLSNVGLCARVHIINDNQWHAYIIPLLSTGTHTHTAEEKGDGFGKGRQASENRLESEYKAPSGKAIKQFLLRHEC